MHLKVASSIADMCACGWPEHKPEKMTDHRCSSLSMPPLDSRHRDVHIRWTEFTYRREDNYPKLEYHMVYSTTSWMKLIPHSGGADSAVFPGTNERFPSFDVGPNPEYPGNAPQQKSSLRLDDITDLIFPFREHCQKIRRKISEILGTEFAYLAPWGIR
jgi:hypothetical protein